MAVGRNPMKPACFSLEFAHEVKNFHYTVAHVVSQLPELVDLIKAWNPELIVSFAAQGEGQASFDPQSHGLFWRTNALGMAELFAALIEARPKHLQRFIHCGTSELYGSCAGPAKETDPLNPSSPYAASKAAADLQLIALGKRFPWNVVRPSNCYAAGQQIHRIIPRSMLQAMTGGMIELHGGGKAEKSYLDARDLCAAILLIAEKAPTQEIYNCGPDAPISIRHLVQRCADQVGVPMAKFVSVGPEREGQDSRYHLDSSKLKSLGWSPQIVLDHGLFDVYRWINAYRKELMEQPQTWRLAA